MCYHCRTTSLRTVSSSRSAGATPKTGTLNSRDIHFGHNASASSGSHTLEMSRSHEDVLEHTRTSMTVEKAEVHDDSSHGSRSLSSPPQDRMNLPANDLYHQQHPPPAYSDLQKKDSQEPIHGTGAQDDFNYSYYKISYDATVTSLNNQNANDNDDPQSQDFDDLSHDSYKLTESRGSLDGELDKGGNVVDKGGSLEGLDDVELDEDLADEEIEEPEEHVHIIGVQPISYLEDSDEELAMGNNSAQVELQVVERVEKTKIIEKVEKTSTLQKTAPRGQKDDTGETEKLENVRVEVTEKSGRVEETDIDSNGITGVIQEQKENGEAIEENWGTDIVSDITDNNMPDDIPYILHKRHLVGSGEEGRDRVKKQKVKDVVRLRSPSPRRPQPQHFTKEQEKAQLDKIKSGLSEPIVPIKSPKGSPTTPQPAKSPGLKRALDFVVYSKLPPMDSFSYQDDSLSPSLEKEIVSQIKSVPKQKDSFELDDTMVDRISAKRPSDLPAPMTVYDELSIPDSDSDHEAEMKAAAELEIETEVDRILSEGDIEGIEPEPISSGSDELFDRRQQRKSSASIVEAVAICLQPTGEETAKEDSPDRESSSSPPPPPPPPPATPKNPGSSSSTEEEFGPPPPSNIPAESDKADSVAVFLPPPSPETSSSCEDEFQSAGLAGLQIPSIIIRAASPMEMSSSDDELQGVEPKYRTPGDEANTQGGRMTKDGLPEPDEVYDVELHIDEESLMQEDETEGELEGQKKGAIFGTRSSSEDSLEDKDTLPPPTTGPLMELSSESDVENLDTEDLTAAQEILERSARTSPYSIPLTGLECRPQLPDPDISSDSEVEEEGPSGSAVPNVDLVELSQTLESQVSAKPFSVPVSADEYFPAPPEHDISSDSEEDRQNYQVELDIREMSEALRQEAEQSPYRIPLTGQEAVPALPQHDVSSDSEEEELRKDVDLDLGAMSEALEKEARTSPFHVPLTGMEDLPTDRPHDVSSDSDNEKHTHELELDLGEISQTLEKEAKTSPFRVPLTGAEYIPGQPEHDVSSDDEDDKHRHDLDLDLSEMSQTLEDEAKTSPYRVPLTGTEHVPGVPEHDVSSDSEDEHPRRDLGLDLGEMSQTLEREAKTSPFHVPLTGLEHIPGPPEHDVSSDEDVKTKQPKLDLNLEEMSKALKEEAQTAPYSVPRSGEEHIPGVPEHDVSSDEDVKTDQPELDLNLEEMSKTLKEEAQTAPYSVPRSGEEHIPGVPEHDVSSDSEDERHRADPSLDMLELSQTLEREALQRPFSVPRGEDKGPSLDHAMSSDDEQYQGDHSDIESNNVEDRTYSLPPPAEEPQVDNMPQSVDRADSLQNEASGKSQYLVPDFPAPPDISSESEVERPDMEEHVDAVHILESEVITNPYSLPCPVAPPSTNQHRPIIIDSSSDSDEDFPDASAILQPDIVRNPYAEQSYLAEDPNFPSSLPPLPRLPEISKPVLPRKQYPENQACTPSPDEDDSFMRQEEMQDLSSMDLPPPPPEVLIPVDDTVPVESSPESPKLPLPAPPSLVAPPAPPPKPKLKPKAPPPVPPKPKPVAGSSSDNSDIQGTVFPNPTAAESSPPLEVQKSQLAKQSSPASKECS